MIFLNGDEDPQHAFLRRSSNAVGPHVRFKKTFQSNNNKDISLGEFTTYFAISTALY
jgi:hypothetical protein